MSFDDLADASMYAHYLFNAFDTTNNGSIKFKVSKKKVIITTFHISTIRVDFVSKSCVCLFLYFAKVLTV